MLPPVLILVLVVTATHGQSDSQIQEVTELLWANDVYRPINNDVQINRDGSTLFQFVRSSVLQQPTFAAFIELLDNYEPMIGIPDPFCPNCEFEQNLFLDEIMKTAVMQIAWQFLRDHGLAASTESGFKDELRQYWFMPYSRSQGAALDSSGFEHVFLGETRSSGSVTGFHNWIQYYLEETKGNTYMNSYLADCNPAICKLGFDWLGATKSVSSYFLRTTPEFEMALYTVCFQARQSSSCWARLNNYDVQMQLFSMSGVSPRTVGTAYPNC